MECFAHLRESADRAELIRDLQTRVGIGKAAESLAAGTRVPAGLNLLKLAHFLKARDYVIAEFGRLDPVVAAWGARIACADITLDESARAAGYVHPHHAYRVLFGRQQMSPNTKTALQAYLAERGFIDEQPIEPPDASQEPDEPVLVREPDGAPDALTRRIVDHATTMFNSFANVVGSVELRPAEIFDSDRMQIAGAMQKILSKLGVTVMFPQFDESRCEPLSPEDLSETGLHPHRRRRK
jgi:hypothetical protein